MTVQELIDLVGGEPLALVAALVGIVAVAFIVGMAHGPGRGTDAPWRYVYAVLVYAACVPGVLATLLTAYTVLFLRGSLLQVNVAVYFAPIVAMAATLAIVHRNVDLDDVPGFDRLSGLILMIAASFAVVFVLSRLFFGVIFFGSIPWLIALTVFVFALIKWGAATAFRRRGAPRDARPSLSS